MERNITFRLTNNGTVARCWGGHADRIAEALENATDGFGKRLQAERMAVAASLRAHRMAGARRMKEVLLYSTFRNADLQIVRITFNDLYKLLSQVA